MASTALEEKINKIRQKNEEIRRRHEEVEADKQNAAKLNALVKMVPPTDWPERKEPPEFSNPPAARNNGNPKQKASAREYRGQQQQYHAGGGDGKKTHVFAEGDGPPPDPSYNFLADSEREERTREDSKDNDRFRGRGGPVRGSSRRRGGGREGHSKEYRGSFPGPKDASKPEYEAWRAERNRIDEARISRQRTAEGNWRREWDNNKINVEENETGSSKSSRLDTGDIVKKDHKEFGKWQVDETLTQGGDQDSPRGRGGKPYVNRGASRGSYNNRGYQHSNSYEQYHGPVSPPAIKSPPSPNGVDERTVVATDKSIKVIVNHGQTPPKGPVMSVKVSSSSIAGTGRVGPRQKPRVLYSSQSETEASGHEADKYSSHKSSNDKTNRVYFNQDVEEQHRYVPKSPHPQRKTDGHPKSPYSPRKEFKYDAQQHRHGDVDVKLPYQQRREAKDSPKSPHFSRKADFPNRDSHVKQKQNITSEGESFKLSNSQKRMPEKTKHDSQKSATVSKKTEDSSVPKPQRPKKRIDKSKNVVHNNPKGLQESTTSDTSVQLENLGKTMAEESSKNQISNGDMSHNEISNTVNDCEKNNSATSVTVEHIQDTDSIDSKTNIEPEIVSPSISSIEIDESVPAEDNKSNDTSDPRIDNSETITLACANVMPEIESESKNVEAKITADSVTLISDEIKTSDSLNKVDEIKASKESPETADASQKEMIKSQSVAENSASDCVSETKNVQELSDNEVKHEELNSTLSANPEDLEKSESKPDDSVKIELHDNKKDEISKLKLEQLADEIPEVKNESQNEKQEELSGLKQVADEIEQVADEIPDVKNDAQNEAKHETSDFKPERVADEISQSEKIAESISVGEKVDSSIKSETQISDEKIANDIGEPVVKDSEAKAEESPVI